MHGWKVPIVSIDLGEGLHKNLFKPNITYLVAVFHENLPAGLIEQVCPPCQIVKL